MENVVETLEENGYTVWKPAVDSGEDTTNHVLITSDKDADVTRARLVNGRSDNDVIHVQDTLRNISSLDAIFVSVDDQTLVVEPTAITTTKPAIPLGQPTAVNPRWLEDWCKDE